MASRHRAPEPLYTEAPFDLLGTVRLLQRRVNHPVERWVEGGYQRVHRIRDEWIEIRVEDRGRIDDPDLHLSFPSTQPTPTMAEELSGRVRKTLGLDTDVSGFWEEAARFPELVPIVRRMRGMRPPRFSSLLESILSTVPFQQMSLDAGMAIFVRLLKRLQPEGAPAGAFPDAETIASQPEPTFTEVGFSHAKARALREAAAAIQSGALDEEELERLPTADALLRLQALRGIGPWSAHLILLRGYGRLDAFPPKDAGVTRGLETLLGHGIVPERWAARFGDRAGMSYFVSLGAALIKAGTIPPEP